ncbi:cell division protein PerM [Saccharopolyspora cebuensis]|uniref:DUF6350 family protein n=1 Tax=Saccharopolyspora cebuensis TaxID=418759 RepID=A0ABV4CE26_9PSEU
MSLLAQIPHAIAEIPGRRALGRWLLLPAAALGVLLTGYLGVVGLLAFAVATAPGADVDLPALLLVALPGWLAAHQVSLTIDGAPLGVLPLLPTCGLALLVAVAAGALARRLRLRRPDQAWPVIAVFGAVHALAGVALALLVRGPVQALPVDALLSCGLLGTVAATAGLANRCGLIYLVWGRVEAHVWSGLRIGVLALAGALAVGGSVLLLAVLVAAGEMAAVLRGLGGPGAAIGATLLSVLYVPNAVIGSWAFAAGPGLSLGALHVRPVLSTPGPVPDLPLLAVLPAQESSPWWLVVLAAPVALGALVGLAALRVHDDLAPRLLAAGLAAVVVSVGALVAAAVAGGRLGGGDFGPVSLHPGSVGVMTLFWLAVPALLVAWFGEPAATAEEPDVPEQRPAEPDDPDAEPPDARPD